MNELERYLRVYITKHYEEQWKRTLDYQIDIPGWKRITDKMQAKLEVYKEILEQLDLHKEMME